MSDVNSNHAHFSKTLYSAAVTTHDIYIFLSVLAFTIGGCFKYNFYPTANVIHPSRSVPLYTTKEIHRQDAENIYMKFRFKKTNDIITISII